ncbi:hypothetical protein [Burkholderia pseudomallei]|uniref:hypothetical protein n=1 Tax=Burkholderia pseudomallei TaxID=28450 RepID=UPI0005391257|nr:hypothetical protein [Burkholderia pseudomallei]KGW65770.1 hypothetical protein Y039_1349 [Burkholderia pseudomallei MSHR1029]
MSMGHAMEQVMERARAASARHYGARESAPPGWFKSRGGPGFCIAIVMSEEPVHGGYELEITPEILRAAPGSFLDWMEENTYGEPLRGALAEKGRRWHERLSAKESNA